MQSNQSVRSQEPIKRKPSPVWTGSEDVVIGEMVETVGQVWGVAKELLEKDVAGMHNVGSLDQVGGSNRFVLTMTALFERIETSNERLVLASPTSHSHTEISSNQSRHFPR